jgi:hypothetical protein
VYLKLIELTGSCTGKATTDNKGTDDMEPFFLIAKSEGGTGQSAQIRFSTQNLQNPSSCSGRLFDDINVQDETVQFSPTYSPSALRTGAVTLTGSATFPVDSGGLVGSYDCEYTIKLRPTDGSGI